MTRVDAWLQHARWVAGFANAVWPARCVLCNRAGQSGARDICRGCEQELPANERCCAICALPLQTDIAGLTCGVCAQRLPRFDRCTAPYRFAYPIDHMIRRLKYRGDVAQGRVLGDLFAMRIAATRSENLPEALLPVPLGSGRYYRRGYNQAIVLAEQIERRLAIPLLTDVLVRTRDTREQAGLDQRERRKNIRRAFAVTRALSAMHVAIVDDVVTTGSTVNEVARVLKRAGAQRIEVWAIARAGR